MMAVWNETYLSSINMVSRADAEYFQPAYNILETQLYFSNLDKLSHIATITDGIHASPEIADNGIRYISAKCVKNNCFVTENCITISNRQNSSNLRTQLRENDIIITTVGTIGNVAVVDKDILPSNCDRHVGIIRIKKGMNISPFYISTFLNSKYGYFQSFRESAGNVQLNLYIKNIGNIKIPRFSENEEIISGLTKKAYLKRKSSNFFYLQAQNFLEKELGLDKLTFKKSFGNETNFSKTILSSRIDAEYFQPQHIKFAKALKKNASLKGRELYKVKELLRCSPQYGTSTKLKYIETGVPFLRIADLSNLKFDKENLKYISPKEASGEKSAQVTSDDILISRSGSLGLTIRISDELAGSIFGSYFIRLRLNDKVNPQYFSFYMNSLAGKIQVTRYSTGGVQTNLTIPAIESFQIVLLRKKKEEQLLDIITQADDAFKRSLELLEQAKQQVENLIEQASGVA